MAGCFSNTAKACGTTSTRTPKAISPKPRRTGRDWSRKKGNSWYGFFKTSNRMNLTSPSDSRVLIESVLETLQQGETLLTEISDETYTRRVPIAFNASIGGHYRHCLDHFRSLLNSALDGHLKYDHRERDTLIEKDRYAALNATRELRDGFERLDTIFLL